MYKILLVEDDKMLNQGIAFNFQMDGFEVFSAFNLMAAEQWLKKENIDLILLDVNLPDGNGFDFCKSIKDKFGIPIIFLTACDMDIDIITGLRIGADDYITKPFNVNILRERVITVLRRCGKSEKKSNILELGEFKFDFDKMSVQKNGENIILAPTEYKLLRKIVLANGDILTRQALLEEVWENDEYIEEHALTVNINRLRNKIENKNPKSNYIKTVYGIGYAWAGEKF